MAHPFPAPDGSSPKTQQFSDLPEMGIDPSKRYTDEECEALLRKDIADAYSHVDRCIHVDMPTETAAAFTSAAFNLGPRVVCGSTLQKKANAGDLLGACRELTHARVRRRGGAPRAPEAASVGPRRA